VLALVVNPFVSYGQKLFVDTFDNTEIDDDDPVSWIPGAFPGPGDASSGDFVLPVENGGITSFAVADNSADENRTFLGFSTTR